MQITRQWLGEPLVYFTGKPVRVAKETALSQDRQAAVQGHILVIDIAIFGECSIVDKARLILLVEDSKLPTMGLFERPLEIARRIPGISTNWPVRYFFVVFV